MSGPRQPTGYARPRPPNDRCPECGQEYVVRCRCFRGDMRCANGHEWHTCTEHGVVAAGPSDHGKEGCTCVPPQAQ